MRRCEDLGEKGMASSLFCTLRLYEFFPLDKTSIKKALKRNTENKRTWSSFHDIGNLGLAGMPKEVF